MRIRDLLGEGGPTFSFEFFPPKTEQGERVLLQTISHLRRLNPSFVSVTYGAGGSTRQRTVELVTLIKRDFGIETMAHLTCVGHSRAEILSILDRLAENGIENLMALRGDPPQGSTAFVRSPDGFAYASELVTFIRARGYNFCLGGGCYPEGHAECPDRGLDLEHLRRKVDAGLDFAITQLFFDNAVYHDFVERARRIGILLPIIPGIMPITNAAQIERLVKMSGASLPEPLRARLREAGADDEAVRAVGVEHALDQCRELLQRGVPGVHFYTLNQSPATASILSQLRG